MPKQVVEQEKNWYVIHTYSGYEDAVAKNLKQRIESLAMEGKIFNVIVPKEKKVKIKNGKRKTVEEKIYPGYVLVEMIVDDESWYVVQLVLIFDETPLDLQKPIVPFNLALDGGE